MTVNIPKMRHSRKKFQSYLFANPDRIMQSQKNNSKSVTNY